MPRGAVYFIEALGSGMVKIGFTTQAASQRMRSLQTASPFELKLLAWLDDFPGRENTVHVRFDKLRVRGEWFKLTDDLRSFIAGVKERGPQVGLV